MWNFPSIYPIYLWPNVMLNLKEVWRILGDYSLSATIMCSSSLLTATPKTNQIICCVVKHGCGYNGNGLDSIQSTLLKSHDYSVTCAKFLQILWKLLYKSMKKAHHKLAGIAGALDTLLSPAQSIMFNKTIPWVD